MDFRGRGGDQVLKPGGGQANLGDRGGAGNRPGGGSWRRRRCCGPSGGSGANRPAAAVVAPSGPVAVKSRAQAGGPPAVAETPLEIFNPAERPVRNPRADTPASVVVAAAGGGAACGAAVAAARGGGGGGGRAAAAVVADGDPISRLSTTSSFSGASTTAWASIALPTTAAASPMSASWRRKCRSSGRTQSSADRTATCASIYDKLGVRFQTYQHWIASGARVPATSVSH